MGILRLLIQILDCAGGIDYPAGTVDQYWRVSVGDISDLTDTEQLLDKMLSVTYAELVALKNASELIAGQKYIITDFAQAYNIFDGGDMTIIEEQIGAADCHLH